MKPCSTSDYCPHNRVARRRARDHRWLSIRGKRISERDQSAAKAQLVTLVENVHLVDVSLDLVNDAARLAEQEALRGDDAVHLATALFVGASVLSSADTALCDAADRQGMHIANPLDD